ncbi:tetratricopeptide repeat protein [Aestuariibacter halophilus]|uniref:Tetratricopeptide repeat protein n=1 Tax=Fluctibacter halophilus TaxID=226011 RepID=A0ABS8G4H3_9ALTE|nr:tetratricopeptide repeat protein [Aestuariibacter halophilus]MCC2615455.1 tetratricopeptide repeat protein [Aestuariibacter halophilus]
MAKQLTAWGCLIMMISHLSHAGQPQHNAVTVLAEAKAHLSALPDHSIALLQQTELLDQLPPDQQAQWYFALLNAARRLANLDTMHQALQALVLLQDTPSFSSRRTEYLNNLGAWFRRHHWLLYARASYQCALAHASDPLDQLKSRINLAVIARNFGDYERARALNLEALEQARQLEQPRLVAAIHNNLGTTALSMGDLPAARSAFQQAMDMNQKLIRRASELLSGLNLLYTFVQQKDDTPYQRLLPRIKRMLDQYPNLARQAYLQWIEADHDWQDQQTFSKERLQALTRAFHDINDVGIQTFLLPVAVALKLDVSPDVADASQLSLTWLNGLTLCQWPDRPAEHP